MIIADTNLVVYAVVEGPRTGAAARVRRLDAEWVAPPLWASEFRNALVSHVRAGALTAEEAREAWPLARALVRDAEVAPIAALDFALGRGLSAYDAEFGALASALGVPLVTDDSRVLNASPGVAVSLDAFPGPDTDVASS